MRVEVEQVQGQRRLERAAGAVRIHGDVPPRGIHVGPALELGVVRDPSLERDGIILGVVRRRAPTRLMPATYLPSHFTRKR
jgi:hypothetical protein